ncbi:MAG: 4-(cytidine 5'-diphospho)-2-C-methyl-D-erythritol kinase [Actinomycetales bacterium]|nr:4-(cytidine 5'-diphospho)-2-C-methyl-D-erythritol kinase [Actinomycetales bacterium]
MSPLEVVGEDRVVHVRAPGKINLSLRCGPVGEDGYHPLVTTFQAVSVYEEVSARPGDGVSLTVSGAQAELVPTGPENLAARAAVLLAERAGIEPHVALHVRKDVPVAGGMAGGSADAAAALVACDALWRTGFSREELTELAGELGADVPFTLLGHTAVGQGRGHLLSPALVHGQFHWVLAIRHEGQSTPAVYARFDERTGGRARLDPEADVALLLALRRGDPGALGAALHNDLQQAALDLSPDLEGPLEVASEAGALGAVVSGSGPTVAVLARSAQHALELSTTLAGAGVADEVRTATGPVAGATLLTHR